MRCKVRMVVVRMGLHGRRRHRRRRRRQMDICLLLVNDESVFNTGSELVQLDMLVQKKVKHQSHRYMCTCEGSIFIINYKYRVLE
jgi:hypothetical protein